MKPETRQGVLLGVRLALAHHPLCSYFDGDVFGRRVRICAGCAVAIPSFLIGIWVVGWALSQGVPSGAVLVAGLAAGIPQASTLFWRGPRPWRLSVKAVGGLGLAALLLGLLLVFDSAWVRVVLAASLVAGMVAFLFLRMRTMIRTCDGCAWRRDWSRCPGFAVQAARKG